MASGVFHLVNNDFMNVVQPAQCGAFAIDVTLKKGRRDTGISPFTRCVFHELKKKETRCGSIMQSSNKEDSRLSFTLNQCNEQLNDKCTIAKRPHQLD